MWDDIQELIKAMAEDEVLADAIIGQAGIEGKLPKQYNPLFNIFGFGDVPRVDASKYKKDMRGKSYDIPPGPGSTPYFEKASKEKEKEKEDYSNSKFKALFLAAALDKMRGKEGTPAPVVTGSPSREFPTMARMMTPMEQQKPYWWIR